MGDLDSYFSIGKKSDKSVIEFSIISLKEVKTFFYYNESNIGKEITEKELKEQGGVCKHYAEWYIKRAKEQGLFGKPIIFFGTERIGHEVALIWNANLTEYCILDQDKLIGCNLLGETNESVKSSWLE